ncbi:hypothetical protein SAMN04488101_101212 [Pedobacter nyackensis]|uniref:Uncharacterized protein n=1 Tax=Pedobacter nyackensis TaxID=475255 RepID=A0A1W2A057_9SPHI|nr:hypothetical protein SAMN04488101_101212 [Pedobacter nyackensis]
MFRFRLMFGFRIRPSQCSTYSKLLYFYNCFGCNGELLIPMHRNYDDYPKKAIIAIELQTD